MDASVATESPAFITIAVIGTVGFAVSGVMAAARAGMDWLGAMVLAVVVAIGGGTIRDLLLGQLPVSWLQQVWPSDCDPMPIPPAGLRSIWRTPQASVRSPSSEPRSGCARA